MTRDEPDKAIDVLIVDDDRKLCQLVKDYLEPMGYRVSGAYTGPEGLEQALDGDFQVIVLDVMLPGMDGFEVLKEIRRHSDVPVLMLTARGEEADRIVGLELGADDYLPKTFSTRELLARLRAVTRRTYRRPRQASPGGDATLIVRDLRIEEASHSVTLAGRSLELAPVEYALLVCLVRAAGRVLSRDQLLDAVAGRSYEVFDRSIDVHVSSLRRKLGDDPRSPRYIKTVRAVGYLFLSESRSAS